MWTACDVELKPATIYATAFRRKFLAQAGKIKRYAHKIVLTTTKSFHKELAILWQIHADCDYSAVGKIRTLWIY